MVLWMDWADRADLAWSGPARAGSSRKASFPGLGSQTRQPCWPGALSTWSLTLQEAILGVFTWRWKDPRQREKPVMVSRVGSWLKGTARPLGTGESEGRPDLSVILFLRMLGC